MGRKHGGCGTRLYGTWSGMKQRCFDPNAISYSSHGGRGIRVCSRWRGDFAAFRDDIGERPAVGMSIDRIDNEGHYSCGRCEECRANGWPMNVRWATQAAQMRNTRVNRLLTCGGVTKPLKDWAELAGVTPMLLTQRLDVLGWDAERAVTTPPRKTTGKTPERYKLINVRLEMIYRCHNPGHPAFAYYGGRGLTVCARWRESLDAFRDDVSPRPAGLSLDRIDNAAGYWCGKPECSECGPLGRKPNWRWATREDQAKNRRPRSCRSRKPR